LWRALSLSALSLSALSLSALSLSALSLSAPGRHGRSPPIATQQ